MKGKREREKRAVLGAAPGVDGPRGAHLTLTIGLVSTPRTRPDRLLVASDAWSAPRYRLQGWIEAVPGVLGRPGIDSTVFGEECDSGTSHSSELADHGKEVKCDMESKSSVSEGIQESFRKPKQRPNRKCHHPLARLSVASICRSLIYQCQARTGPAKMAKGRKPSEQKRLRPYGRRELGPACPLTPANTPVRLHLLLGQHDITNDRHA